MKEWLQLGRFREDTRAASVKRSSRVQVPQSTLPVSGRKRRRRRKKRRRRSIHIATFAQTQHTRMHARMHAHTHACTHAHTHTHICMHTHTHTHKRTVGVTEKLPLLFSVHCLNSVQCSPFTKTTFTDF